MILSLLMNVHLAVGCSLSRETLKELSLALDIAHGRNVNVPMKSQMFGSTSLKRPNTATA